MTHLGELVKGEFEKRNFGSGYDPKNETYTPWYRFPKFHVQYKNQLDEKDDLGSISLKRRAIEIKKGKIPEMAEALYHEIQHANLYPLEMSLSIGGALGMFWLAYANSQGNFRFFIATFAATGFGETVSKLFNRIEERYISRRENQKFKK